MSTHEKFLEFNGKNIVFLNVDGVYWIALKPICEALNIDVRRSRELAKNDPILGSVVSEQALQTTVFRKDIGSVNQTKQMTCLPEKYIYGWLFSLRSDSPELIEYKKTCYDLLYNHFHGTITNRKELLLDKRKIDTEIFNLKDTLKENDKTFQKIQQLEVRKKQIVKQLSSMDKEIVKEPEMF